MLRHDIAIATLAGTLAAILWVPLIGHLIDHGRVSGLLLFAIPAIFAAGLVVGAWLGEWRPFFHRLAKFAMVGVLNSGIDFTVFNALIAATGIEKGPELAAFKSLSFVAAIINSYLWNRYWVFAYESSAERAREIASFLTVTISGFVINVGITALIANAFAAPFGVTQIAWDNVAAGIAILINLTWNFAGYHMVVFKKAIV